MLIYPFNSWNDKGTYILFSNCGCTGRVDMAVPKQAIESIGSGRSFALMTGLIGILLLGIGLSSQNAIATVFGVVLLIIAFAGFFVKSLWIVGYGGSIFMSTNCCNDEQPLLAAVFGAQGSTALPIYASVENIQ